MGGIPRHARQPAYDENYSVGGVGQAELEDIFASDMMYRIDEYQLVVHPVALGNGRALFKDLTSRLQLHLIEAVSLRAGSMVLRYQPMTTDTGTSA